MSSSHNKSKSAKEHQQKKDHQADICPPLGWREEFTYVPKTPNRNHQQKRVIHNLISWDEDELQLPTPSSIPKKNHRKHRQDKNSIVPPPPQPHPLPQPLPETNPNGVEQSANSGDKLALGSRKRGRKAKTRAEAKDLLKALEDVVKALRVFSSPEEVASHLTQSGVQDLSTIHELRAACNGIAKLLPSPDQDSGAEIPSTIEHYDKTALYYEGDSGQIYLMQTLEAFAAVRTPSKQYTRQRYVAEKTFGYIRLNKNSPPLMCSFSGGKRCTDEHPRILDAELWTNLVKYWVNFYNQPFQTSRYDNQNGPGHCHATHVEPRLLLWFGSEMVKQKLGLTDLTNEQLLGHIWELRDFEIEAELIISHINGEVCPPCKRFHAKFCRQSGMKITFKSCPTVGQLKMSRNAAGNNVVEKYAYVTEREQGSEETQGSTSSRRPVVEIRSKITTIVTTSSSSLSLKPNKVAVLQAPFQTSAFEKAKEMKGRKAAKASKRSLRSYVEGDDEDDLSYADSPERKKGKFQHR